MGNGYGAPQGDDFSVIIGMLQELSRRLSELETPTGTSVNSLVTQVQQALANITATVIAAVSATSYTKTQIDAKDTAVAGQIQPAIDATLAGNVTVGGQFKNPDAVSFVITGTRRSMWIEDATGRTGNTSSSRRFKQDIEPAAIDVDAFLSVGTFWFHYIAEIRKRDDPTFEEYVGPDYLVPDEYGLMAEDLHNAGLTYWVYYDADGRPEGVNYTMLVVPLLSAAQHLRDLVFDLRHDVDEYRESLEAERVARLDLEARIAALESKGL